MNEESFKEKFPSLKGKLITPQHRPSLVKLLEENCLDKAKVAEVINNIKIDGCFLSYKVTEKIFDDLGL